MLCTNVIHMHTDDRTGNSMNEAEVRFSVVDAIVKYLMQCSNTLLATEMSVHSSEANILTSNLPPTTLDTPTQQKHLSANVVPDYTFFSLTYRRTNKRVCGIAEVKSHKNFDDNAVCQTVGYHISRRVSTAGMCIK